MIARSAGAALALGLLLGPAALADETPRYFIHPVTTDLQRQLVPPKTDLCVLMDATAALKDNEVSADSLGLDRLKADLVKQKVGQTNLHFHLYYGTAYGAGRDGQARLVHHAVIGFAHELGFPKVTAGGVHMTVGNDRSWADQAEPLARKGLKPDAAEPASGDANVKVYPVRTPLSRYLADDTDCVVLVGPAVDGERGRLPNKYRAVAAQAVAELKLPDRKRIAFHVRSGQLTDAERRRLREDINQLGRELGSVGGYVREY
jgi:hypothetical protein